VTFVLNYIYFESNSSAFRDSRGGPWTAGFLTPACRLDSEGRYLPAASPSNAFHLPPYRRPPMPTSVLVEIRAAEGGDDSKLLVRDQAAIYCLFAKRHCL
jgi:hypothetical protein